jgi:hypothetical protein
MAALLQLKFLYEDLEVKSSDVGLTFLLRIYIEDLGLVLRYGTNILNPNVIIILY